MRSAKRQKEKVKCSQNLTFFTLVTVNRSIQRNVCMPGPLSVCYIFERTERISTKFSTGRSLLNVMKLI